MSIVPTLRVSGHEVWVTLLLFFCLLLFVWVRVMNPKKIPSLASGFLKGSGAEEKTITPDSVVLFFIFICSVSLLAMQAMRFYNIQIKHNNAEEFLLISLFLS